MPILEVGLVGVPPCIVDDDKCMAKTERNGAMLGNSTAVRQLFVRQYCKSPGRKEAMGAPGGELVG